MEQLTVFVNCAYCGEITEIVCPFFEDGLAIDSVEAVRVGDIPLRSFNNSSGATCAKCRERMQLYWSYNYYVPETDSADDSADDPAEENEPSATDFFGRLARDDEQILMHFPIKNGRVVRGPYPYRFVLEAPHCCALLIKVLIWSVTSTYENVIQVKVDEKQVAEVRQGYDKQYSVRIDVGDLVSGRHTISFDAHYENADGTLVREKTAELNPADGFWILQQLAVVGKATS